MKAEEMIPGKWYVTNKWLFKYTHERQKGKAWGSHWASLGDNYKTIECQLPFDEVIRLATYQEVITRYPDEKFEEIIEIY